MSAVAPAERAVWLRLPRVHPLMILPAAVLGAAILGLLFAAAAVAMAASVVAGIVWPPITLLTRLLTAALNYGTEVGP